MGSALGDAAVLHHYDPIAGSGLGEPVRDHQPGTTREGGIGGTVEQSGVSGASFGGGLVEDRQLWVGQHQASERHLLCLRGSQLVPATTEHRVEAIGQ